MKARLGKDMWSVRCGAPDCGALIATVGLPAHVTSDGGDTVTSPTMPVVSFDPDWRRTDEGWQRTAKSKRHRELTDLLRNRGTRPAFTPRHSHPAQGAYNYAPGKVYGTPGRYPDMARCPDCGRFNSLESDVLGATMGH